MLKCWLVIVRWNCLLWWFSSMMLSFFFRVVMWVDSVDCVMCSFLVVCVMLCRDMV